MNRAPGIAAITLLLSCDGAAPRQSAAGMPLPQARCAEAKTALDALTGAGRLELAASGEATVEEAVWLQLGGSEKDSLAGALAIQAACAAEQPPVEQQVVIRSEYGDVLLRRVVPVSAEVSLEM